MKRIQPSLSSFLIFILICFTITSCSWFGGGYQDVYLSACNSSPATVVDTVSLRHGRIGHVSVEIDGVPIQKWVLLPDDSNVIYDPCNLPNEAKKANAKIYFEAYILSNVLPVQDTALNGFVPIEITHLQKN